MIVGRYVHECVYPVKSVKCMYVRMSKHVDKSRNVGLCSRRKKVETELSVTNSRGRPVMADAYKSRARSRRVQE
jgi:hypothetical protein